MKRFPKLLITLLVLAMVIGIFAAIPVSAAEYQAIRLKTDQLVIGHYTSLALTGELVQHCAAPSYKDEAACLVDNDNGSAFWSKPYKFSSLKANGGTIVPAVIIDLGAEGAKIAGFDMMLRSAFDCQPLHFELQATTSAGSNNWTTLLDKKLSVDSWDSRKLRFEFAEVTVYKFRLLVYDIAEADIAKDSYKDYTVCLGDETRFSLAEIDLLQVKESSGSSNSGSTTKPTTGGQTPTRPAGIQIPTKAPTQNTTQAPTQAPTKAPVQNTTQAPTKAPAQNTTQAPTQAPTKAPGQTTTVAPTQPATQVGTVAPTEPATVDPSAPTVEPTVEPTVDPSAPTVDPSAPTEEPTVAPTEETTEAPTTAATEPEATTGTTDTTTTEEPKDFTAFIVIAIVAALVIAGGAVFFIIKKKKNA